MANHAWAFQGPMQTEKDSYLAQLDGDMNSPDGPREYGSGFASLTQDQIPIQTAYPSFYGNPMAGLLGSTANKAPQPYEVPSPWPINNYPSFQLDSQLDMSSLINSDEPQAGVDSQMPSIDTRRSVRYCPCRVSRFKQLDPATRLDPKCF